MIHIKEQPLSESLTKLIYEGFSRHAIAMTGHDEKFDTTAFVASVAAIFAGAVGVELFWGALHITHVYVKEEYRGRGIGTLLMDQAMDYGRRNKCPFAFVATMSFQAREFYEKRGFTLEFTRSGYKHGTSFHYLRKEL